RLGTDLLGHGDEVLTGVVAPHQATHGVLQARRGELGTGLLERLLEPARLLTVEAGPTLVGAHHDEWQRPQLGLLRGVGEGSTALRAGDVPHDDGHSHAPFTNDSG